jgi:hypothetical protein
MAHHGDTIGPFLVEVEEFLGEAPSLRTEDEKVSFLIARLGVRLLRSFRKEKELLGPVSLEKGFPGVMETDIHIFPVVEPCPPQVFVIDLEPQRGNEVERRFGRGTETGDAPRVGGDLGFD